MHSPKKHRVLWVLFWVCSVYTNNVHKTYKFLIEPMELVVYRSVVESRSRVKVDHGVKVDWGSGPGPSVVVLLALK